MPLLSINKYFILNIVACFLIGTCIGSFLNVCIYRTPRNISVITPGSFCPVCHNNIPFYFNIPVLSYIFLRGYCSSCKNIISIRYPLIELLTGILYALIFVKSGIGTEMFYWCFFISTLIIVSFIDIDYRIIPDRISIPGIFIFSTSCIFLPEMTFIKSLTGSVTGAAFLYSVAALYYLIKNKEGLGRGDIKLLAMIGAALGIKGVFFTIFCGSVLGAISGGIIMIYHKKDINFQIPFAPFLSTGALIYIFYGNQLINCYLDFL